MSAEMIDVFTLGIIALVAIGFLGAVIQGVLSYLSHRSLNDMHSLGIQAIIGVNEMDVLDRAIERRKKEESKQ